MPHWAVLTPDGRKAYTANKKAPYISVLDLADGGQVRRVPVTGSEGLALSPNGSRLFVATPTFFVPVDPGAEVDIIEVVAVATDEIVHRIRLSNAPGPVHVTADEKLLVAQWPRAADGDGFETRNGWLSIFDAVSYRPLAEFEVGIGPINITATPDGATAFVSNLHSGTVSVIDLHTYQVADTLEVDRGAQSPAGQGISNQGAHGMAFIPPRH